MDWNDRIPRQMINQVYRFITLSQKIDEIYPPRDGLRLLFLKICMESLCKLDTNIEKRDFYGRFADCFSKEGNEYILKNFRFIGCFNKDSDIYQKKYGTLTLLDFLRIIKYIRDQVVHDGIFWDVQVFAFDTDSIWLTSIETDEELINNWKTTKKKELVKYHFETTLQFDRFIYFFTQACINYVNRYIDEHTTTQCLSLWPRQNR